MWIAAQILIDIVFAVGLIVLAATFLAHRTTSEELEEIRDYVEQETRKLWADVRARMDGGTKPR